MNNHEQQPPLDERQGAIGAVATWVRRSPILAIALALIVALVAAIAVTGLVGLASNGQSMPEPTDESGDAPGTVTGGPTVPAGDDAAPAPIDDAAWLSPEGLVLPPRTDEPRKSAMYAALAIFTWDTARVSRQSLLDGLAAHAQPTPEWEGFWWPRTQPDRQNTFFVLGAESRIPTTELWAQFAASKTASSAIATEVLLDDELVAFGQWVPTYEGLTGPDTGTHLVTVRLEVTVQGEVSATAPEAGTGGATGEQSITFEVQCDAPDAPSAGQCGVIRVHKTPTF